MGLLRRRGSRGPLYEQRLPVKEDLVSGMGPASICRIVIYNHDGKERPAIVADSGDGYTVDLDVFARGRVLWKPQVRHGGGRGEWRWPGAADRP
jgi:hypothetical protein